MNKKPVFLAMLMVMLLALSVTLVVSCDDGSSGGGGGGGGKNEAAGGYTADEIAAFRLQLTAMYDQYKPLGLWDTYVDEVNAANGTKSPKSNPKNWTSKQIADFFGPKE